MAVNVITRARRKLAGAGRRLREARRTRQIAARSAQHLTPPPPSAFGAFGTDSVIGPPSRVTRPDRIFIGDNVVIHEHAWISVVEAVAGVVPKLVIGDRTRIDRLVHIACVGEVEIGADVLLGERVLIGDTFHQYEDVTLPVIQQPMAPPRKVTIGRGAGIGMAACIMPGVTIGENAYVAAGSVVNRDVPPRSVVAGNPGRVLRKFDDEAGRW